MSIRGHTSFYLQGRGQKIICFQRRGHTTLYLLERVSGEINGKFIFTGREKNAEYLFTRLRTTNFFIYREDNRKQCDESGSGHFQFLADPDFKTYPDPDIGL